MNIIISILFIIITILSIIIFKVKGLLILIITLPLYIIYLNSNKIIDIIKKKKEGNNKDNLLERKEVEFVSSSSRRGKVNDDKKKKKKVKPQNKKQANKSRDKKEKSSSKKKGIVRKILTILLGFAIFCVFAATAFMIYIVVSTSNFDPNALVNQDQTVLYDKDGNEFATLGVQKRESVTYDQLPQVLVDAIVATEDSRYYQHNGVDMARFLKATALNLIGRDDAGGASTLTMQTVKNNLTKKDSLETNKIKKIIRKFQDVYLSVFFMEKKY